MDPSNMDINKYNNYNFILIDEVKYNIIKENKP
jgi:hypothetical protein